MTPRKAILLGILVLGLVGAYALSRSTRPLPEAPVAAAPKRPLDCRLSVGEELAFHVRASSTARSSETEQPQQLSLEATLWWRVLEERAPNGWVVAATLNEVRLHEEGAAVTDTARRAALETPFLLQVGRDCRFQDFAFEDSVEAEARRQLQGVLQAAELILPRLPRTKWVARHRDTLGAYDATYTVDDVDADGVATLTRGRGAYIPSSLPRLPPQLGGQMRVEVLASKTQARLQPDGRWVRWLSHEERVRIRLGQKRLSDVSATVDVERLEGAPKAPAAVATLDMRRFTWGGASAERKRSEPGLPPPPEPALAAMSLDDVLGDFTRRLAQGTNSVHEATERLASYLSVHPEAITELLGRMRGGALPEQLHPMLFLALEKTGTLAAESGLSEALGDRGMGTHDRMRAAAALQDIPRPSERTARSLISQARASRANAEERQVADASLLALGALSHRVESHQPEVARLAHEELGTRLRGARGSEDLAVALDAIGNSGDASFADTLQAYARDESPLVRAHAARAWRRMPAGTEEAMLTGWLAQEPEARVRRAIADTLAEQVRDAGHPASSAVLAAATARLAVEPDAQARAALIALVGSAAATDASARLALVQQFHRETVPDLQVLIGRFVKAEDLR